MSTRPELYFIGGFLGAGKTTAINALAFLFSQRGLKVAAITNDQAQGLVDTYFLSGAGLPAAEVTGSCFCCNFPGLVEAITHSVETVKPDVILAEPVGSCTDIVATVVKPMRALMGDKVDVKGYSVLVEPDRWAELGDSGKDGSWSMKFLFDKQLEEADFIVITKLDTISEDDSARIRDDIAGKFPHAGVVGISSKRSEGVEDWLERVESMEPAERSLSDIDYQRYAEAEAEMGWLNADLDVTLPEASDANQFAVRLSEHLLDGIRNVPGGEIGHLKLLVAAGGGQVKTGVTTVRGSVQLESEIPDPVKQACVTINARATVAPDVLRRLVDDATNMLNEAYGATTEVTRLNTFRPAAPNPTHRYA